MEIYFMRKNSSDVPGILLRTMMLAGIVILFAAAFTGSAAASPAYEDTAIMVFTDWHSNEAAYQSILDAVSAEADKHQSVIVCFNGDSETRVTSPSNMDKFSPVTIPKNSVSVWQESQHTRFMDLVGDLLKNPKVIIIMGMGNHELAINPKGSSSKELASYFTKLQELTGTDFNNRFYIVNTDLAWKSGGSMDELYGETIHRSVMIHGITFLAVLGSNVVREDMGHGKVLLYDKSQYPGMGDSGDKDVASTRVINENMKNHVYQEILKTHPSACVLLAHSSYNTIKDCVYYLNRTGLPKNTYLFTGHNHANGGINKNSKEDKNIKYDLRAQIQPKPFGRGVAVVYATPNGEFVSDSEKRLTI